MTYLITFPGHKAAEVFTFERMVDAERAANAVPSGAVFVLGTLNKTSLAVLTVPLLTIIHNTARPDSPVKTLRTRQAAIQATLPLIPALSKPGLTPQEETTMATRKKASATKTAAKKAPAKKAAKKAAAPATTGATRGRKSRFAGATLIRTEKGTASRHAEGSRRTASWNVIPNGKTGMKYETALEKGAHKDDISIMVRDGVLAVK